jgi:hypothetical protein
MIISFEQMLPSKKNTWASHGVGAGVTGGKEGTGVTMGSTGASVVFLDGLGVGLFEGCGVGSGVTGDSVGDSVGFVDGLSEGSDVG